jgi:glycosyltransferase involved in cell wall biosynthesis
MGKSRRSSIVVASPHYGYSAHSTRGGGVYERELIKRIGQHGVELHVLLNPDGGYVDAPQVNVGRVEPRWLFRLSSAIGFFNALRKQWRMAQFDLIRAHNLRALAAACAAFHEWVSPIPYVVHILHLEKGLERFYGISTKRLLDKAAGIVTISEFSAHQVTTAFGIGRDRILVTPPGIDCEQYKPHTNSAGTAWEHLRGRKPLLLYVGSLVPRKNLVFLCDVVAWLRQYLPDVGLIIAGSGPAEQQLKKRVILQGLQDRVYLVGAVSEADKVTLYNACDIFVFPSLLEGFGMAPAEAMACEKPVVVSREGALIEIVNDGRTGLLADPTSIEDFGSKVRTLCQHPERAAAMGREARTLVRVRYDWERTAKEVAEFYRQCVTWSKP